MNITSETLRYSSLSEDEQKALSAVLEKIGSNTEYAIQSSGGSSVVIIPVKEMMSLEDLMWYTDDDKDNLNPVYGNVYQYFFEEGKAFQIFEMLNRVYKRKVATMTILNSKVESGLRHIFYFGNLARIVSYLPKNIVVWRRHRCLNEFSEEYLLIFLKNNYTKLLWDVGKALLGLHSSNYVHKDCSIDNVGFDVTTNQFIVFDFNLSRRVIKPIEEYELFENDFHILYRSLRFRLGKDWAEYKKYTPSSHVANLYLNEVLKKNALTFDEAESIVIYN